MSVSNFSSVSFKTVMMGLLVLLALASPVLCLPPLPAPSPSASLLKGHQSQNDMRLEIIVDLEDDLGHEDRHEGLDRQQRRFESQSLELDNHVEGPSIVVEETSGTNSNALFDIEIENVGGRTKHRGLVPQLWANYTGPYQPPAEEVSCNVARMKCAYRAGCGLALQNYILGCSELAEGKTKACSVHCRHSLIALMSTPEGQRLMKVRS